MTDEEEQLEHMTEDGELGGKRGSGNAVSVPSESPPSPQSVQDFDLSQWQVCANGKFRPAARTVAGLPPGCYITGADALGPFVVNFPVRSDEIVELPEAENHRVVEVIRRFWAARERYEKHGLLFKRGILLWGPPGSGKTVTIRLLTQELIDNGGIVLFCDDPDLLSAIMGAVRRIEPTRPLIIVLEDIDEIIRQHGEHGVLAMLDGEHQTDNVVCLATTNYIGQLGARIVNRPSRFDERIYVGMPSYASRVAYLTKAIGGDGLPHIVATRWAQDTDGFSIAHLRELVAAVHCLGQEYESALDRLKSMCRRPKEKEDEFQRGVLGFGQEAQQRVGNGSGSQWRG